jgi:hypothetical protein
MNLLKEILSYKDLLHLITKHANSLYGIDLYCPILQLYSKLPASSVILFADIVC